MAESLFTQHFITGYSRVCQRRVCSSFSMPTSHLPASFPAESPVISAPLMGKQCEGEARGITTETAGALVTASVFSKPAQWQSGNFPLNHRKRRWWGTWLGRRNRRKMYIAQGRRARGPHAHREIRSNDIKQSSP